MKTWICTPLSNFYGVMQGAARLYAYLKNAGHDVVAKDFNQDTYFKLLSRENLEEVFDKLVYMIEPSIRNSTLRKNMGDILMNSSYDGLRQLLGLSVIDKIGWAAALSKIGPVKGILREIIKTKIDNSNIFYALLANRDVVLREIERSRKVLDEKFFSLEAETFLSHFRRLLCGKAIIDACYFPVQLDFGFGFHGTMYGPCVTDIDRALADERYNFLIKQYEKDLKSSIGRERPDIIGISITHTSDIIPAFTLARVAKDLLPEVHVCLGGATLTETAFRIRKNLSLWNYFDSLALGPGEHTASALIEHLEKGKRLNSVPNLVFKDNGTIRQSDTTRELDLNETCCPEYVGVRPRTPLPLESSSGCYWGKCIFCYYPKMGLSNIDAEYDRKRTRGMDLVIKDFETLQSKYNPSTVGFTDSSFHPERLEKISEYNIENKNGYKYSAFIRFEKEFKNKAFCRKLARGGFMGGQVGLESGSERTNKIINKGVKVSDAREIIRNFHEAGISVHLYTIVGVPGERVEDAKMTYQFIKDMRNYLELYWQVYSFYVFEHGAVAARADEFGLKVRPLPDEFLAQIMMYEVKEGISQRESVALSLEYTEKLKRYIAPINNIMDIETTKQFILMHRARGMRQNKLKRLRFKDVSEIE